MNINQLIKDTEVVVAQSLSDEILINGGGQITITELVGFYTTHPLLSKKEVQDQVFIFGKMRDIPLKKTYNRKPRSNSKRAYLQDTILSYFKNTEDIVLSSTLRTYCEEKLKIENLSITNTTWFHAVRILKDKQKIKMTGTGPKASYQLI